MGGWELAKELVVSLSNIERIEEVLESSKIWPSFKVDGKASVTILAVIYVREKMIIGLTSIDG